MKIFLTKSIAKWKFTVLIKIKLLLQLAINYFHIVLGRGNGCRSIEATILGMVMRFKLFYGFIANAFYHIGTLNAIISVVKIPLRINFLFIFFKTIYNRKRQLYYYFFGKKTYDLGWVNDLAVFYPGGSIKLAEGWVN
jgi:hypothetical protein